MYTPVDGGVWLAATKHCPQSFSVWLQQLYGSDVVMSQMSLYIELDRHSRITTSYVVTTPTQLLFNVKLVLPQRCSLGGRGGGGGGG